MTTKNQEKDVYQFPLPKPAKIKGWREDAEPLPITDKYEFVREVNTLLAALHKAVDNSHDWHPDERMAVGENNIEIIFDLLHPMRDVLVHLAGQAESHGAPEFDDVTAMIEEAFDETIMPTVVEWKNYPPTEE